MVFIMADNNISIAEPNIEHYEAFIEACKKMQAYINDDSIPNDVGKHESKGFIFANGDYVNMSRKDFEEIIVNGYKEKAQDGTKKPEYFKFIMDGNTIVGSVNVRGLPRDEFDEKNGLTSFEKWDGKRVTTSSVILPEYRGKGIVGKAKKLFFDEIRALGIKEVTSTVLSNNDRSNKAQEKMMKEYGGRMYQVYGDSDGTGVKYYNRYVISTDTSGNSKDLYKEKQFNIEDYLTKDRQKISENKSPSETIDNSETIAKLRGILPAIKAPNKPQQMPMNHNTLLLLSKQKTK